MYSGLTIGPSFQATLRLRIANSKSFSPAIPVNPQESSSLEARLDSLGSPLLNKGTIISTNKQQSFWGLVGKIATTKMGSINMEIPSSMYGSKMGGHVVLASPQAKNNEIAELIVDLD